MAFRSAQTTRAYIGILAASAYTRSVSIDATNEALDTTTLADTTKQYIVAQNTSTFSISGPLDDSAASNGQWDALTDQKQSTTSVPISILGLGTDGAAWLVQAVETNFGDEASVGDTVNWSLTAQTDGQTDMVGVVLENNTTITADTDGSANTGPAGGTSNGAVAHLHVTAFSGFSSDDIIIEGSTSGAFAGEETTVVTFAQVTGLTSERVAVTGTVPRYLRVADDVTGTGSITRTVVISRR